MNTLRQYIPRPVKKAFKPLYLRLLPAPTPFIVLTRGRTGSNLLISLLGTHPDARMFNEIFSQQSLENSEYCDQMNRAGAPKFVQSCFRRTDRERAIGAKILYYQIERDYAERFGISTLPEVTEYFQRKMNLRVIHLKRRNRLRTIVSWELARATNRWARHSDEETMNDEIQITIPVETCAKEFIALENWERKYDSLFSQHTLLPIYYEDLVADTNKKMGEILNFLSLPPASLTPGTKKQTSKPITEVLLNYSELKNHFQNTRWSEYFR